MMDVVKINGKGVKRKTECFYHSTGTVVEVIFTWTIDNFSFKHQSKKNSECIKSISFSAQGDEKAVWQLHMYPRGNKEENKDFVSLFLHLVATNRSELIAKYEFCVLDDSGGHFPGITASAFYNFSKPGGMGFYKFIPLADLLDKSKTYLCNDRFTVKCKIEYEVEHVERLDGSEDIELKHSPTSSSLADNLVKLYDDARGCDITLVTEGKEFKAHKLVLGSRSPIFSQMFGDNLRNPLSRLKIESVNPEVFQAFLRFMYTDKVEDSIEMARQLLAVADSYQVWPLKLQCEQLLTKRLTIENCAEFLTLADTSSSLYLKKEALKFIRLHSGEVVKTSGWKIMRDTRPQLAFDIFESAIPALPPVSYNTLSPSRLLNVPSPNCIASPGLFNAPSPRSIPNPSPSNGNKQLSIQEKQGEKRPRQ